MQHLGKKRPGSTVYCYFDTFDGGTGASITMTGLAVTDIEVYKNGSVTQRASDSGYTLLDTDGIDFDGATGLHGFSIDLSDNTTAGFWTAGAHYVVAVNAVTVDAQTVRFWAADFTIGYEGALLDTTIATLSSQTSFTLTAGSADNSAYLGCPVVVHDIASGIQIAHGYMAAYTGATKTVTLNEDPGIFTMAAGDNISVFPRVEVYKVKPNGLDANSIQSAAITSAKFAASAIGATAIASNAITAAKIATDAITADKIAADAIGSSELATAAVNEIRDAILADSTPFNGASIAAILTDTGTTLQAELDGIQADTEDIQARLPAALVGGRMSSDAVAISGSTSAADTLEASVGTILEVAAEGTPSTTVIQTDAAEATDNHFNGRLLIGTSGVCLREARTITGYTGSTGTFTTDAFQTAPSASDTFIVV